MAGRPQASEDFKIGYEAGWVARGKQRDVEAYKRTAELALLRTRLKQSETAREKAEARVAAAEKTAGRAGQ